MRSAYWSSVGLKLYEMRRLLINSLGHCICPSMWDITKFIQQEALKEYSTSVTCYNANEKLVSCEQIISWLLKENHKFRIFFPLLVVGRDLMYFFLWFWWDVKSLQFEEWGSKWLIFSARPLTHGFNSCCILSWKVWDVSGGLLA